MLWKNIQPANSLKPPEKPLSVVTMNKLPSDCIMTTLLCKKNKNECPLSVCACVKNKHRTHTSAWPLPKTPGVKVGNILRWQQPFVSKYISKVSNFCGNTEDGGIVHVKLELKLGGRCGCLHRTNATWTFFFTCWTTVHCSSLCLFLIIIW